MLSSRWRPVAWIGAVIILVWIIAVAGFRIASNSRMTAEKIAAFVTSTDLSKLSPEERAKAIRELAEKLNALSVEERRLARFSQVMMKWFEQMTEAEKSAFLEATMPTGFKQMITAFEQLPEEKRQRAIEDALRRLREARNKNPAEALAPGGQGTNAPALSPELQAQIRTLGLKTFYSQSSAQTKAEMAPVLEELQRVMESGRMLRR
jgi:hypothetical protein